MLNTIGNFDENYSPAFFEDNDIKYRAVLANYGIFVANTVCFFHFGSITSATMNFGFEKNREYYYSKYPFAEYLSATGAQLYHLQKMSKFFKSGFPGFLYKTHIFINKVKNRLKKGLIKR